MAGNLIMAPQQKTGIGEFQKSFEPYLQLAMQMMMKRKMEEQQREQAIIDAGIGTEKLTPAGEAEYPSQVPTPQFLRDSMGAGETMPVKRPSMSAIPEKFKQMTGKLDKSKLEALPEGYSANLSSLGIPLSYTAPEEDTPWGASGVTDLGRSKLLGTLMSGYFRHPLTNSKIHLTNKEDAAAYAQLSGYVNYADDPEVASIIDALPSKTETTAREGFQIPDFIKNLFSPAETPAQKKPGKSSTDAATRFEALTAAGMTEEEAYTQLTNEGF